MASLLIKKGLKMKTYTIFAAIIIASLSFIACDSNNASDDVTCTVTYDATSLNVYQSLSGVVTYEVEGVYSSKYDGIVNYYEETYVQSEDAISNCNRLQNDSWYDNVVCSGNTITYQDFNEMSIEDEALDFQEMCDEFLSRY